MSARAVRLGRAHGFQLGAPLTAESLVGALDPGLLATTALMFATHLDVLQISYQQSACQRIQEFRGEYFLHLSCEGQSALTKPRRKPMPKREDRNRDEEGKFTQGSQNPGGQSGRGGKGAGQSGESGRSGSGTREREGREGSERGTSGTGSGRQGTGEGGRQGSQTDRPGSQSDEEEEEE
jgi:hypothetical protein